MMMKNFHSAAPAPVLQALADSDSDSEVAVILHAGGITDSAKKGTTIANKKSFFFFKPKGFEKKKNNSNMTTSSVNPDAAGPATATATTTNGKPSNGHTQSLDLVESAKKAAAYKAVDDHFPQNAKVVGIGSGSTVVYVVDRIAQRSDVSSVVFVPTGFQSKQLLQKAGLIVGSIDCYQAGDLDVAFDGADEVDALMNCIKGGGGCLFQEKLVSMCARKFVIVADYRKKSESLGTQWTQGVPIEVVSMAYNKVSAELYALGATDVVLRQGGKAKAGPIVTDNNNFILDAVFPPIEPSEVCALDSAIKLLVGVVETGLFLNGDVAYFGEVDGSYSIRNKA